MVACGDSDSQHLIENEGLIFKCVKIDRKSKSITKEMYSLLNIYKLIKDFSPDIIHNFTIKPVIYTNLIFKLFFSKSNIKVVSSITGLGSSYLATSLLGKLTWVLIKSLYKFSLNHKESLVIFENPDDRDVFLQFDIVNGNMCKIVEGAGIDTKEFFPKLRIDNSKFVVTLVSRLLGDKGIREYIEAGKIISSLEFNDVQLNLVGDVDLNNISSLSLDEVNNADVNGYIKYLGRRSDICHIYQESNVACLPSYREGLPKSLIEAAACGLPIITTDVPGCRQMVVHQNGILIPARDPKALADAILFMRSNQKSIEIMGEKSRLMALNHFDYSVILQRFEHIYGFCDR